MKKDSSNSVSYLPFILLLLLPVVALRQYWQKEKCIISDEHLEINATMKMTRQIG